MFEKLNFELRKFQVLPVFIDALPLRQDFEENKPAYGAIFKLFHTNNEAVHTLFVLKICSLAHFLGCRTTLRTPSE
jgi:hypothetical protein